MVFATTISPQNHKNKPEHELQNTKHNDSQTDNLSKYVYIFFNFNIYRCLLQTYLINYCKL